jgi:hypothetical protein
MRPSRVDPRQTGQILIFAAIVLPAMFAILALIVDAGFAYASRRDLQNAADNAALAGTRLIVVEAKSSDTILNEVDKFVDAHAADEPIGVENVFYVDASRSWIADAVPGGTVPSNARGVGVQVARLDHAGFFTQFVGQPTYDVGALAVAVGEPGKAPTGYGGLVPIGIPIDELDDPDGLYDIRQPQYSKYFSGVDSNFKGAVDFTPKMPNPTRCEGNLNKRMGCWSEWGFDGKIEVGDVLETVNGDLGNVVLGHNNQDGIEDNIIRQNLNDDDGKGVYGIIYVVAFDVYTDDNPHDRVRVADFAAFKVYLNEIDDNPNSHLWGHFVGLVSELPGGDGGQSAPTYIRLVEPGIVVTPQPTATTGPTATATTGPTPTATSVPTATATVVPCQLAIQGAPWTTVSGGKVIVHWTTDQPSDSLVQWSGDGTGSASNATVTTSHSVDTGNPGMNRNKAYTYTVTSFRDCGGGSTKTVSASANYP